MTDNMDNIQTNTPIYKKVINYYSQVTSDQEIFCMPKFSYRLI